VVVGSLPTAHGGALPAVNPIGCLIVLDSHGRPVETWVSQNINGPWDMTMQAHGGHAALFISNVVQGPTGLALGRSGTLYVASTTDSSISAIPDALTRTSPIRPGTGILTRGGSLNGPLGLTLAPNGNLIAVNGNNGNAVEVTPTGRQVATVTLVPHGTGDLFGVTPLADGQGLLFVNDGTNALDLFSA
jgi:hypothetical protein